MSEGYNRLVALAAGERIRQSATGITHLERACHKAAAEAYENALGLIGPDPEPLAHLLAYLETQGEGGLVVAWDGAEATVALEFGREAEDSPMAGGAAYGVGDCFDVALRQAASEVGWKPGDG